MFRVRLKRPKLIPVTTEMFAWYADCAHCGRRTELIAVNGVKGWVLECPRHIIDPPGMSCKTFKINRAGVLHMIASTVETIAHDHDRLVFWTEDDEAYHACVKAMKYGHMLWNMEEDNARKN